MVQAVVGVVMGATLAAWTTRRRGGEVKVRAKRRERTKGIEAVMMWMGVAAWIIAEGGKVEATQFDQNTEGGMYIEWWRRCAATVVSKSFAEAVMNVLGEKKERWLRTRKEQREEMQEGRGLTELEDGGCSEAENL